MLRHESGDNGLAVFPSSHVSATAGVWLGPMRSQERVQELYSSA